MALVGRLRKHPTFFSHDQVHWYMAYEPDQLANEAADALEAMGRAVTEAQTDRAVMGQRIAALEAEVSGHATWRKENELQVASLQKEVTGLREALEQFTNYLFVGPTFVNDKPALFFGREGKESHAMTVAGNSYDEAHIGHVAGALAQARAALKEKP